MTTNNVQTLTIGGVTRQIEDVGARQLISSLQAALNTLTSGDTTTAIESFNEIIAFLENVSDSSTLQGIIAGLNTTIAGKVDKVTGKDLSTNDFTNELLTKLNGLSNYNDTALQTAVSNLQTALANVYTKSQTYSKSEVDAAVAEAGKVKSVTINGTKKTPNETTGDVDLGTVVGEQGPQGPAGPQGNSGVASADGIESVNNLNGGTTDTAEKVYVLGANMGKELSDRLAVFEGVEVYTRDAEHDHDGKHVYAGNGNFWDKSGFSVSRLIHLTAGQTINVRINVVTSANWNTNVCIIALNSNGTEGGNYKGTSNGSIAYVSNTVDYSYTAPEGGMYVAVGYEIAGGFTATINTGSQMEKNKNSIEAMLERLGGVEIPFRSTKGYYQYANNTLSEVTDNGANYHYHTEPIPIANYKALYFRGQMEKYNGYFCAVFYDGNGDFLATGLYSRKPYTNKANFDMVNVLDEAPSGAASVVLQSNLSNTGAIVIGFTDYPYQFIQNKWWKNDYYGIKGDGVTDDTAALQMLIMSSGGDVELKPGKYLITAPIIVDARYIRKISGNGATIIIDADNYTISTHPYDNTAIGFYIYGDHTGSADPSKTSTQMLHAGFVMEDVHITSKTGLAWHDNQTGTDVGKGTAIKLEKTSMVTIRGCQIFSVENGIEFYDKNRNTIIDGCFIYNCWDNGILFGDTSDLHQLNIVGCHISYCKTLIFFDDPNQINNYQISGCDLECSRSYPYGVTEGAKRCIKMVSTKKIMIGQIEITGNTIQAHANRDNGGGTDADFLIDIESLVDNSNRQATYTSIVGNHMSNVGQYAIRINGGDQYTIAGNTVGNTGGSATNNNELTGGLLYLEGTVSDIAVTGNTLRNHYNIVKDAYMVNVDEDASVTRLAVTGNVGNNTPISVDGASQDYISVVGNCLGGGTVTIGTATHKQEANNI